MTSGRAAPDQGALRILHVSEVTWGGVPSLMRHFTDEQVRAGHEVHLLAPEDVLGVPGVVHHRWRLDRRGRYSRGQPDSPDIGSTVQRAASFRSLVSPGRFRPRASRPEDET